MNHVPGELHVFGTSGDYVMFETLTGYAQALRADLPADRDYNPGDTVPGYIHRDGSYHPEAEG